MQQLCAHSGGLVRSKRGGRSSSLGTMTGFWSIARADELIAPGTGVPDWLVLDDGVRARIAGFVNPADSAAAIAARALAALAVSKLLGMPREQVALVQTCPNCGRTDHGRPSVQQHPQAFVSWSRSGEFVAAVAALDPAGIDVERLEATPRVITGVMADRFSEAEQHWVGAQSNEAEAFVRVWCRKEATVKLGGITLDTMAEYSCVTGAALHAASAEEITADRVVVVQSASVLERFELERF